MTKKTKIAILISGRGSNMQALIEACKDPEFPAEVVLVLSNKADAKGLEFAKCEGIKTAIIEHKRFITQTTNSHPELVEGCFDKSMFRQAQHDASKENLREEFDKKMAVEIENSGAEIICLAGFMRLLSPWFVNHFFNRIINIHPSLLPEFKGADAVGDAIKAGAKKSGCTVHFVREEMDSGPIIKQAEVEIFPNDSKETLAARILKEEHKIYPQALKKIIKKS